MAGQKIHLKISRIKQLALHLIVTGSLVSMQLTSTAQHTNYIPNRAPLVSTPFITLPLGSIEAKGWLATQLNLQKDGLTGYSELIYSELSDSSAWLGGKARDSDWERPPYYVKGLVGLAYTLQDAALKSKVQKWIDWTLNSQVSDGSFGPASNNEWWARMPMLTALMDYCDATNDARVVSFLTKYFQYQANNIGVRLFKEWANARAADNVDVIFWLYNRTGDTFLLDLADKIKSHVYNYTDIFTDNTFLINFHENFYPKHGVNVSQGYKYGPVFYQRTNNERDKNAFMTGIKNLRPYHTQITGMNSCTEFLAGNASVQGVELCSTVERMFCDEIGTRILGDARIGDDLERIAFNELPASMSDSIHQHQYYTLPNQVQSIFGHNGYGQDYENGVLPGPYSGYPCCRFNMHMGWPKYAQFSWMATSDNGLAATAYAPTRVTAKVANGVNVSILEDTNYPFEEQIRFTVALGQASAFPLKLRIPAWCSSPVIKVNGIIQSNVAPASYYTLNRTWSDGDVVTLDLPMTIETSTWVNNAVGIERGPLVYSLKMDESWSLRTKYTFGGKDFSEYEIYAGHPWNYGLVINREHPETSITVEKGTMTANPFSPRTTPVKLHIKARRIPSWDLDVNGIHASEPPVSPAKSGEPEEEVTLIPFGAERIRVTYFPVIGTPANPAATFADDFATNGPNKWTNFGGGWQQKDGKYYLESYGIGGAKSVAMTTIFSDVVLDVTLTVLNNNAQGGVLFRVNHPANGADAYNGYYAGISTNGQIILGKSSNAWTEIKSVTVPISKDKSYHIRVIAKGTSIQVFVDNMEIPVISTTDESFQSGSIGLRQYGGETVIFENISATNKLRSSARK
jgi:hypothetical protein